MITERSKEANHIWKAMAFSWQSRTGQEDRLLFQSLVTEHFPQLEQPETDLFARRSGLIVPH
jgi:hypothetical protein